MENLSTKNTIGSKIRNYMLKVKESLSDNTNPIFLLLPQIVTFIIFAIFFSNNEIYPFGDGSVAWCDLKQQGIPLLMNLKDVLSGDGSIFYSFNNASGMNFWGVFLFFLSNPFSFLCVLFPKDDLYKLVSLLMILKLCTSSFTATLYFTRSNKNINGFHASILGVSYALCAYGLMYNQNLMWLDLMYLFPLLTLSIERVIAGKGYGFYTIILTLCVLYNFYLSYMIIIALLIIIGLYMLVSKQDKLLKKKAASNFFKGSAVAAMLSAVSWLPAFMQYGMSGRGESIVESLSGSKWYPLLDTILLILLSTSIIVIGFFNLIKPNRKKAGVLISFAIFTIPFFVEPINKMWHTGSYMAFPARFGFITVFTGLELVAIALEERLYCECINGFVEKIPKKFKYLLYALFTIIGAVVIYFLLDYSLYAYSEDRETFSKFTQTLWASQEQLFATLKIAGAFALFYLISTFLYKIKMLPKAIFTIFLALLVTCEGIFAINAYIVSAVDRNVFKGYDEFLDLDGKIDDEDFYRIKTEVKYQDSNLLGALGYNSIGHYTSLTNQEYMNTSKALGYSSSWMELSTYGGTELSNAILGVRYNVIKGTLFDCVYTNGTYSIVETFGSLGLGVKYSGSDDVFSYTDGDRTDFQQRIFSTLFGSDEKLFERYEPETLTDCIIKKEGEKIEIQNTGEIVYTIDVKGSQTLYFDAFGEYSNDLRQSINKAFNVYVNGNLIAIYPDGMYTGFVDLGTFKDETVTVKLETTKETISMISFGVVGLNLDVLREAIDNTESGYLQAADNRVWGEVNATKGEKLFISIPHDKGFKVRLNGEKVEAKKVFGDFYSIELTEGKNVVEMKYTPPGFIPSLVIVAIGIICIILLRVFSIRRKKALAESHTEYTLNEDKKYRTFFYRTFIFLFVLIIFAIYVLPIFIKIFG